MADPHDETQPPAGVHDVPGECNAHLYLADDQGDNVCTIRCHLESGHDGAHIESFYRDGEEVQILWYKDERRRG